MRYLRITDRGAFVFSKSKMVYCTETIGTYVTKRFVNLQVKYYETVLKFEEFNIESYYDYYE